MPHFVKVVIQLLDTYYSIQKILFFALIQSRKSFRIIISTHSYPKNCIIKIKQTVIIICKFFPRLINKNVDATKMSKHYNNSAVYVSLKQIYTYIPYLYDTIIIDLILLNIKQKQMYQCNYMFSCHPVTVVCFLSKTLHHFVIYTYFINIIYRYRTKI